MLAVLSPAKTLDMAQLKGNFLSSSPAMGKRMAELLPHVKKLTVGDLKKTMSLSDSLAKLNHDRYSNFNGQPAKQTCLAMDGPAFRGLCAGDFDTVTQQAAQKQIRVLSGLYGILRPYDKIRPYRLEMGSKLITPSGKTLYDFWGTTIAEQLVAELNSAKASILVNCASKEYWKSVKLNSLPSSVQVITCDFPGPSVFAKKARGLMCRHIAQERISKIEGLKRFVGYGDDRYAFNASKSSSTTLVFIREVGAKKRPAATTEIAMKAAKRARH